MSSLSGAQVEVGEAALPQPCPELHMLKRAQAGDRAAYGDIVLAYQDRLYNAVLRLLGDREEAQEVTQETFTRGLQSLDSFRGHASPYTWLFRIAINQVYDRLRKVQRRRVFSLSQSGRNGNSRHEPQDQASALVERLAQTSVPAPDEGLERQETAEQVLAALGRLDSEYRAVLVMRDVEGFDYQQMADVLSLPLGTLKSKLFRARLALRNELEGYMSGSRA